MTYKFLYRYIFTSIVSCWNAKFAIFQSFWSQFQVSNVCCVLKFMFQLLSQNFGEKLFLMQFYFRCFQVLVQLCYDSAALIVQKLQCMFFIYLMLTQILWLQVFFLFFFFCFSFFFFAVKKTLSFLLFNLIDGIIWLVCMLKSSKHLESAMSKRPES